MIGWCPPLPKHLKLLHPHSLTYTHTHRQHTPTHLTPSLVCRYIYRGQPYSHRSEWDDVPSPLTITVLHFKWHAAVLRNMQDRVKFYKGESRLSHGAVMGLGAIGLGAMGLGAVCVARCWGRLQWVAYSSCHPWLGLLAGWLVAGVLWWALGMLLTTSLPARLLHPWLLRACASPAMHQPSASWLALVAAAPQALASRCCTCMCTCTSLVGFPAQRAS